MRLGERTLVRTGVTLAQGHVDLGEVALPPLPQLLDRHAKPAGQRLDRPGLQQPQHTVALA